MRRDQRLKELIGGETKTENRLEVGAYVGMLKWKPRMKGEME